jgi:LysM repeat protein
LLALVFATLVTGAAIEASAEPRTHVVKRGETLGEIAEALGVRTDDLAAANELRPDQPLSVGATLKVPRRGGPRFHVVRAGETAVQVAEIEGCSVSELRHYNKLGRSARLAAGQVLEIPQPPPPVRGERERRRAHVVAPGESLNEIAHRYGVGTKVLMRANNVRDPEAVRPGRELVIPDPRSASRGGGAVVVPLKQVRRVSGERKGRDVLHHVMDGQTLQLIARAYGKSIKTLRAENPRLGARVVAGDTVRVPGARTPVPVSVANCGYPGLRFDRVGKAQTIRLLDCKGRVSPRGRKQLSLLAEPRGESPTRFLDRGLLRRIQVIADEFPGRTIRVVSGYRPPVGEREGSRHNYGRALDFSIEGVGNEAVFSFCKRLPDTGCGFYPNSTFVHVDVRDEGVSWVDLSGPGEPPDYTPRRPDGEPAMPGDPATE